MSATRTSLSATRRFAAALLTLVALMGTAPASAVVGQVEETICPGSEPVIRIFPDAVNMTARGVGQVVPLATVGNWGTPVKMGTTPIVLPFSNGRIYRFDPPATPYPGACIFVRADRDDRIGGGSRVSGTLLQVLGTLSRTGTAPQNLIRVRAFLGAYFDLMDSADAGNYVVGIVSATDWRTVTNDGFWGTTLIIPTDSRGMLDLSGMVVTWVETDPAKPVSAPREPVMGATTPYVMINLGTGVKPIVPRSQIFWPLQ